MADAGRRGRRTVPRLWGHLSGDRSPTDSAGVVCGHPTYVVAGGNAPRSAGAGGCPLAPSPGRRPGAGGSGAADRPMGRGRTGGGYTFRAGGAAALGAPPGGPLIEKKTGARGGEYGVVLTPQQSPLFHT